MLLGVGGSDPRTTTPRRLLTTKKSRTPTRVTRATAQPTPIPALVPIDRPGALTPWGPTAPVAVVAAFDTVADEILPISEDDTPVDSVSELLAVALAVPAVVRNPAALLSSSDSLAATRSAAGHPSRPPLLQAFDAQHPRNGCSSPDPLQVYHSSVAFVLAHAWGWILA